MRPVVRKAVISVTSRESTSFIGRRVSKLRAPA